MQNIAKYTLVFLCLISFELMAQLDSIQQLSEVVISDMRLHSYSIGNTIKTITAKKASSQSTTLAHTLRAQGGVYIRENGVGGVASSSIRGTNASHTAVVWNGLVINSQFTGQTDFNAISATLSDNVAIRYGGGSVQYGSGAIGGSIHLNDRINFEKKTINGHVQLGYGSFSTQQLQAKTNFSSNKTYFSLGLNRTVSANDYKYLDTNSRNENGAFDFFNLSVTAGYKLSSKSKLKLYHNSFRGDREFSGTLNAFSDDAYQNIDSRTQLLYSYAGAWKHQLRIAHLFEQYKYYPSGVDLGVNDFGKSSRYTAQYTTQFSVSRKIKAKFLTDYTYVKAASGQIQNVERTTTAFVGILKHQPTSRFQYLAQFRYELATGFENKLTGGFGANFNVFDDLALHFKVSHNYRVPTFNDLYWLGAGAMGNQNLHPELSSQVELGRALGVKNVKINVSGYAIKSKDLIVWQPNGSGIWSPQNIASTQQYGGDLNIQSKLNFGAHTVHYKTGYSFVKAINLATSKELIYVPSHNIVTDLAYTYKRWGFGANSNYTSDVYFTTDNSQKVPNYMIFNANLSYKVVKSDILGLLAITFTVQNMFNKNYQIVNTRPMPGRNFLIQTRYEF